MPEVRDQVEGSGAGAGKPFPERDVESRSAGSNAPRRSRRDDKTRRGRQHKPFGGSG